MKKLLIFTFALTSISAIAQHGFIRGKIIDGESGDGLYGATITKLGTSIGVISDFDGNYSLEVDPGLTTIQISYVSYQTQTIENIDVKPGQVATQNFTLKTDVMQLGEIVVTASASKESELGLMTFQRKSANVLDGASYQTFKKTGDNDLASAIKRVTGVSVQSGKFVYVRGLGDRYTRTTLNGMTIPGLDPDRNDVQIDIFPTSILENVIVYKTFSPNLPGDFTGGIVDVETKNFPEEKTTSFSLGFGYNPDMNLKNEYLSYEGGATDWLGFDDGTRELPFPSDTKVPDVSLNDPRLETLTRSLNPHLKARPSKSLLNTTFTFNHGNQINRNKVTYGYSAIFNYQSRYEFFQDSEFGEYTLDDDPNQNALFAEEVRRGPLARTSVLWSGVLAGSMKFDKHTFSASVFRTQNGVSEASARVNENYDETSATLSEDILTYSQRSVTNGMISGLHQFGKLRFNWKNAYTVSRTYDPDFRATSISITDPSTPTLNSGDGAGIRRFWRDLNEWNENIKLDFTLPFGKVNKFQFGAAALYKDRTFEVYNYLIDATSRSNVPLDPDYFLYPENIWTPDGKKGTYLKGNKEDANNYQANSNVLAGYVMAEMGFGKLKAIYGARIEKAAMYYTGEDIFATKYDNVQTLDEVNILPSVNLVYGLTDNMNLRASYGSTVARPSFKEKSAAQIYDPITKRFFNGNLDLEQTEINNYDLRWENFLHGGDMVSFSLFYKQFSGHIELVAYDVAADNVRPRNAGDSKVYGMEFEARKSLDFISSALGGLSIGSNISLANSEVNLNSVYVNDSGLTEFESRQNNARTDQVIEETRQMAGQSPYLVNAYLNFTTSDARMNANLSYNVQGESLFIIGNGAVPDIFSQPFNSLNFNIYRNFGADQKHKIAFRLDNILVAERKDVYKGYKGDDAIYSIFKPGRTFTLNYSIRL